MVSDPNYEINIEIGIRSGVNQAGYQHGNTKELRPDKELLSAQPITRAASRLNRIGTTIAFSRHPNLKPLILVGLKLRTKQTYTFAEECFLTRRLFARPGLGCRSRNELVTGAVVSVVDIHRTLAAHPWAASTFSILSCCRQSSLHQLVLNEKFLER